MASTTDEDEAYNAFISTMEDQIVKALDRAEQPSNSSSSWCMLGPPLPSSPGRISMPQEFVAAKPLPEQALCATSSVPTPAPPPEQPSEELLRPPPSSAALAARGAVAAAAHRTRRVRGRGHREVPVGAHPFDFVVERQPPPARAEDELLQGPCFLKLLMPRYAAGAIIGKGGSGVHAMVRNSNCQMRFSRIDDFFPGTLDRVLLLSGAPGELEACLAAVLERLRGSVWRDGPREVKVLKLAVPNSAISALLGVKGSAVQRLISSTGCHVKVTPRIEELRERMVVLHGSFEAVSSAAFKVCELLTFNPHMREHANVRYDVQLPLGAWYGAYMGPRDVGRQPLHPEYLADCNKRELVEYLQAVAPRQMLARCHLTGAVENVLRAKRKAELLKAVAEVWQAQGFGA